MPVFQPAIYSNMNRLYTHTRQKLHFLLYQVFCKYLGFKHLVKIPERSFGQGTAYPPCLPFRGFVLYLFLSLIGAATAAQEVAAQEVVAQEIQDDSAKRARLERLKQLPINKLSKVQFYNPNTQLAARKSRALIENPSAVFVLSGDEVRRAGITSLPEALRLIPGVQVARLYGSRWAISARGLNGYISSKLLVMIDGRTIYTPLRSEVRWGEHDMLIEDLDRIEVIRGPGASLWGANAVNGIINIVTKPAAQTQGGLASLLLGDGDENTVLALRYGAQLGKQGSYRLYAKTADYDALKTPQGSDAGDAWNAQMIGFRADYEKSKQDDFMLQGQLSRNDMNWGVQLLEDNATAFVLRDDPIDNQEGSLLGRWQHSLARGEWVLQSYYHWKDYNELFYKEKRKTWDVDFQHRITLDTRQEYLWGAGVRYSSDDLQGLTRMLGYAPKQRNDWLFSAFVQGEFVLQPERWRVLLGSKFEHNDYSGFEYQPSIRLLWSPHEKHRLWAGVSRAVRTPSRTDHDGFVESQTQLPQIPVPVTFAVHGNADYQSESLLAYELGYRYLPNRHFLLDSSVFLHEFKNLRSAEPLAIDLNQMPPYLLFQLDNLMYGEILGAELSLQWQATGNWRLSANYTYTTAYLHLQADSHSLFGEAEEGDTPKHQFNLFSQWDVTPTLQLDSVFYYVGTVENQNTPDYLRMDVHLGWQLNQRLKLDAGVRNALTQQHAEFGNVIGGNVEIPNEIPRSVYIQLRYRF